MRHQTDIDKMNTNRNLFFMSLPIFVELLLQLLVGNIDQMMVSRVSQQSVASIVNANQIMNLVIIVLSMASTAATVILSQYLGAEDKANSSRTCMVSILMITVVSLLSTLLVFAGYKPLYKALRVPEEIFDEASLYLLIVGACITVQGLYLIFSAIIRAFAMMKEVMIVSIVMNVMNIIGNAILINGWFGMPRLGAVGAAVSTDISKLVGLGLEDYATGIIAAGAVMQYIYETQKSTLEHITTITPYSTGQYMVIDTSTRRNLELVETMREKQKRGTLLWVLDKTKTAMGARLLRACIEQPLIHRDEIIKRQNAVEELNMNYISREEICEYLNPIYDLERLIGRISYKTANPRDLIAFRSSLEMLPYIKRILGEFNSELLAELGRELDPLQDIFQLIGDAIVEDPPITVREGGIIKDGYNQEADKLRHAKTEGKNWLAELEAKEKEKTGIKTLKVKFNKVFGYYFEVTNSFKDQVPDYYIRKQTLTNAERFTTDELKQLEDIIMGAEEKLVSLEYDLFCEVRDKIGAEVIRIQKTAKSIAGIDVFCSLSVVATRRNYVKPSINDKGVIQIKNGRHPVVEQMMRDDMFVANDTFLDNGKNRLSVITGPNMAGKSTYMRQVALIVLMAQLGSFVPAQEADIGICDRIFTRVGASDDLASGQSTFMVEMTEVANILRNATRNSLLVLDEIGRGTSTFDGLSIAWAVIEHISNSKLLGAKTLFATHYHELTELEGTIAGVKNYCIAVKEQGDDIVFLRKIVRGGADKSYGIQVAKLAGVPDSVIARAKEIAEELSDADITARAKEIAEISSNITQHKAVPKPDEVDLQQLSFFDTVKDDDIIRELDSLELSTMTPLDAMNTLYRLQTKLKNRWKETG